MLKTYLLIQSDITIPNQNTLKETETVHGASPGGTRWWEESHLDKKHKFRLCSLHFPPVWPWTLPRPPSLQAHLPHLPEKHKREKWVKKRMAMSQRMWHQQEMTLTECSGRFYDIGSTQDQMWEADPNLERSMTIHQSREKMLSLCGQFCREQAITLQTTLSKFFTRK